jgi:hypothetical protein
MPYQSDKFNDSKETDELADILDQDEEVDPEE